MGLEKETVHLSSKEIPKKSFVQRYSYSKTKLRETWKSVRYDQNSREKKKKKRKTQMKKEGRLYYELEAKSVSWWLCGREMRTASLLRFEIRMHSGWLLSPASDMYAGDVNTGFGILRQ